MRQLAGKTIQVILKSVERTLGRVGIYANNVGREGVYTKNVIGVEGSCEG